MPAEDQSGHKGWCQPRFKRSPVRMAYMAKWLGLDSIDDFYKVTHRARSLLNTSGRKYHTNARRNFQCWLGAQWCHWIRNLETRMIEPLHAIVSAEGSVQNNPASLRRIYDPAAESRLDDFAATPVRSHEGSPMGYSFRK